MLGLLNCRSFMLTSALVVSLIGAGCGDSSGPGPLPQRPDAGLTDGGVEQFAIVSPAAGSVITLADDADSDPSNGIQLNVQIAAVDVGEGNVSLAVGEQPAEEAAVINGFASFQISVSAEDNAQYILVATAEDAEGAVLESTATVAVVIEPCTLSVTPRPSTNGCAFGAGADENAEAEGIQVGFELTANCPDLTVRANGGDIETLTVDSGAAQYESTLVDGMNVIEFELANGASEAATETLDFTVNLNPGVLEFSNLNENRLNRLLLSDGEQDGPTTYWVLTGVTSGMDVNSELNVIFEPPIAEEALNTNVRADGSFRFEVSLDGGDFYEGVMSVAGADSCGTDVVSVSTAVRFDAVTPVLSIASPVESTLLTAVDDGDPLRSGIQVNVTIQASDLRPADVDYNIGVECGAVGPNPVYNERTVLISDALTRAALTDADPSNDFAIITFQSSEAGEYICRPFIKDSSNPPTSQGAVWRTYFRQASLNVVAPSAFPACLEQNIVEIRAVGQNIEGNQPVLFYQVTPEFGAAGLPTLLTSTGNNIYTANISGLSDGRYTLSFEGNILSEVPVAFQPESLDIVINRQAPTINFLAPESNRFTDMDPLTPGTQVALSLLVCGAGGQTVSVASVPALAASDLTALIPADAECATVVFPAVNVPLGDVVMTASVADQCNLSAEAIRTASVDPASAFAQIRSLDSGDLINASQDSATNQSGCQLSVRVETNGVSSNASFAVCSSVASGQPDANCLGLPNVINGQCTVIGAGSIEGSTLMECPISLSDSTHDLSFVAVEGARVQSAIVSVNADCSAPVVTTVTVPEDVDQNGCVNSRELLPQGSDGEFTVQVDTDGLSNGTRVNLRDQLNNLFGFGIVTNGSVTVTGAIGNSQNATTLTISGNDEVGNALVGTNGGAATLSIRVDSDVPQMTSSNLSPFDCLGIDGDAAPAQAGLQFTPILDVAGTAGELVNVQVSLDGVTIYQSGPAEISRVGIPQLSLPDATYNLVATVSDTCGNQASAYGFEQVNGNDDWSTPLANTFSIDTVAPSVDLGGLVDGTVYTADQDADGDSSNGFQVPAQIVVDALAPLEAGQTIEVMANGTPLSTVPSPLLMGNDPSANQAVTLTLSAGAQAITVSAQDACGNTSAASSAVNVTLDVNGCASRFTDFLGGPQVLTANDGTVVGANLETSIAAQVDIFEPACVGAIAQLLVDDSVIATQAVPAGGLLNFSGVALASGARNLKIRVSEASLDTVDSVTQVLIVDINTPSIEFVSPTDGSAILTDADSNSANDQQLSISGRVSESNPSTARTVTLKIDGLAVDSISIADGVDETTSFEQTLTAGVHSLELCVADEANPEVCSTITVNADPAAPGAINDLSSTIVDPRSAHVELSFTAPGDDGALGVVSGYAIRVVEKSDPNAAVTDAQWNAAVNSQLVITDTTSANAAVTITIAGTGPGSLSTRQPDGTDSPSAHGNLAQGLIPNRRHFVVVAAIDDTTDLDAGAGHPRLGGFAEATVDLRWTSETFDIPVIGGPEWSAGGEYSSDSSITSIGDVNDDGRSDVLVSFFKFTGGLQSTAAIILGDADPSQSTAQLLTLPASMGYVVGAAGNEDVNGDGLPDFVLGGFTADFTTSVVAVYLGVAGDESALRTSDAVLSIPGRLLGGVSMVGEFNHRTVDGATAYADILVGGQVTPGGADTSAWVIAGRGTWSDLTIDTAGDETADNTNRTNGITTIETTGVAVPGLSATRIADMNNDGRDEIALSGGLTPGFVFIANGGNDLPGRVVYTAADMLAVPSCMNDLGSNESSGFGFGIDGGVDLDGVAGGDLVVSNLEGTVAVINQDLAEADCFTFGRYRFGRDISLAGDLNGDGFEDLVAAHGVQSEPAQATNTNAYVFLNDGNGQFGIAYNSGVQRYAHMRLDAINFTTGALNYETGLSGVSGIGDFDGDGRDDLGAVIKQTGAGSLQLVIYY